MLIVTPSTVLNPGVLAMKQVPRRFFGRALPWPRGGSAGLWLRSLFEVQAFRYTLPLLPFLAVGFTWQSTALALAQAPLLMILMIGLVEMRLLRLTPQARRALMTEDEAARARDHLHSRGRSLLTRIASGRGLTDGVLTLVIEHSPLARIAPLTYVSVQWDGAGARPQLLDLSAAERGWIEDSLFAAPVSEEVSRRLSLLEEEPLRMIDFDVRQVSAHDRLGALIG